VRPLTDRQRRLILRAHDRAVPASELATRLHKTVNTIYRAALEQRAQRLRQWNVRGIELPTFKLDGAEDVILANPAVSRALPVSVETGGDFVNWLGQASALQIRDEAVETHCIAGLQYLLWSARQIIDGLDRHQPRAGEIDRAETRLRWATRLKLKLLAGLRSSLISTAEIHLGRKLVQSPTAEIVGAYRLATFAGAKAIDVFDPNRQGRVGQIAVHFLRTELARQQPAAAATAASRMKREQGAITLPDLPGACHPWRTALELRDGSKEAADQLADADRSILAARFGWEGTAPKTHAVIADECHRPIHRITAAEQRARRRLAQFLRMSST
jgi:hypothetical protein